MDNLIGANDVLFVLLGAIMVLAMHAGFAFLEVGTVRHKNQVNALVKILVDFSVSTLAYFFIGYGIAYGVSFFSPAETLSAKNGYELVKFFFLLTFAAAIPAIISGGIAERAKFNAQLAATFALVGFVYPFFEGIAWNNHLGFQSLLEGHYGFKFHDFAGSVVVHAMGGWIALAAVLLLGARHGRYGKDGRLHAYPPSNIPFLALGAWILTVGWFGFNVMSAQTSNGISGLVALNSLMALVGGTIAALIVGKNDPGFIHNGPLAGLVAVCAGSDIFHPIGALITGLVAGILLPTMSPNRHEKNWMPIEGEEHAWVWGVDPTVVLRLDTATQSLVPSRSAKGNLQLRGSSQVIKFSGGWIAVVHEVVPSTTNRFQRSYQHRFVRWNDDFTDCKISETFRLASDENGLEFCAGLALSTRPNHSVMSYGVGDRSAEVVEFQIPTTWSA